MDDMTAMGTWLVVSYHTEEMLNLNDKVENTRIRTNTDGAG